MHFNRRELLRGGFAAAAVWPLAQSSKLLAAPTAADPYERFLHPELRTVGMRLLEMYKANPPLTRATLASERKGSASRALQPLTDVPWTANRVPGTGRRPPTPIYVINARAGTSRAAILHTHGGGFVNGSARSSLAPMQSVAQALDCVVVTVDYRLAPETNFSGSIEDNYAALQWLHGHAEELGADPTRIAVMGESAGGGHAALLAIAARDRGEVPVAFQCLIYPMLDDRTGTSRQVPPHVGRIGWTPQRNRFGWESFLGEAPGTDNVPARAVPARTPELAGLPPGFIGVGSIDLFFDEDVEYARRLNDAGVLTELIVVPGAFHGFDNPTFGTNIGRWFTEAKINALRSGLRLEASTTDQPATF